MSKESIKDLIESELNKSTNELFKKLEISTVKHSTNTSINLLFPWVKAKKKSNQLWLLFIVAGSIQISNLLVNDLKVISKLKDVLDEFHSEKVIAWLS